MCINYGLAANAESKSVTFSLVLSVSAMRSRWWLAIGVCVTHFDHHFSRKPSQHGNDLLSPRCQKWALTLSSIWCHVSWMNCQTKQDFWMTDHIPAPRIPATCKRQILFFFFHQQQWTISWETVESALSQNFKEIEKHSWNPTES